ncbi:hypothetical protein TMatcc_003867 [Talaromyces marneffei ATCC 18224]|uniref:Only prolin and serin are matching in the corresponding protein n=2 Tax=Talaromyces marneffei TaxID=37727 RepID=B6Q869_TALMQ|nr:conserved hypothetical protein [Talaromyces marneffei ATCC 18224]KAE8556497.1 hypothetical protein EYB25_001198 [Talaromyces marneffei]
MATDQGRKERPSPLQTPIPPASGYTDSTAVSPALSSFSSPSRLQNKKFSSSVSSLLPSPGIGITMERTGSLPIQLAGVKEERSKDIEEEYFGFDQVFEPDGMTSEVYDLTDHPVYYEIEPPKRLRSESQSSRGLSRIGSRIPSMSSRWMSTARSSGGTYVTDILDDELRSRANSAASSTSQITSISQEVLPPARTSLDKSRFSGHSVGAISIEKANSLAADEEDEVGAKASTPLLPPVWSEFPSTNPDSEIASPLPSPTVADVFNEEDTLPAMTSTRTSIHRSPPLSTKPSVSSLTTRARGMTLRTTISGEGAPPLVLTEGDDEWSAKLGHANFTIHPEPYIPETSDARTFRQFRDDWDLARTNYAKHLVRTGEHYGETSMIYKFTKEKWETIEDEWKKNLETIVTNDVKFGAILGLTKSNMSPTEAIKIPRIHDNEKFPELGDEEIVGPMSVAPAIHSTQRCKSPKRRNVFRFLHNLVNRPAPGLAATRA